MEAPTSVDTSTIASGLSPAVLNTPNAQFSGKIKSQPQPTQSLLIQSPRVTALDEPAPILTGGRTIDPDFLCTICQHVIKEAFMTACGHSFCYACITQHLETKKDCPSCGRAVTRTQVFPNFHLNKILEAQQQAAKGSPQPAVSAAAAATLTSAGPEGAPSSASIDPSVLQHALATGGGNLTAESLKSMISVLMAQQKRLESTEKEIQTEVIAEFLQTTKQQKERQMMKLKQEIDFLSSDLNKIDGSRVSAGPVLGAGVPSSDSVGGGTKRSRESTGSTSSLPDAMSMPAGSRTSTAHKQQTSSKKRRVHEHLEDLQQCYFDVRRRGLAANPLQEFSDNLAKFTRFTNLRVVATLKYGDLFNASNIVSCIDFDRDDEYFATGGVTKKIKIFEYSNVVSNSVDVHYPVREMSCSSKVSCLSWNSYIKSQLASSDYEGIVSVWDANTCVAARQYEEHEKRVWCVDFSKTDPTRLASGSDDTKVKIWSTTQANSVMTLDSKANICCVKFNPTKAFHVAFGSADHNIHYYDLRQPREALRVYTGHRKAVSYVKFMSGQDFVTASTDSSLKLWNVNSSECQRTFSGHVNEKNFVGLAANADYIACGSENNSVYAYCKSLSRPIMSHTFKSLNPATGEENDDDASQFVSSVCWKRKSNVLVSANSQGTIKVLELQ